MDQVGGGGGLAGDFTASVNGKARVSGSVLPTKNGTAARVLSNNAGAVIAAAGIWSTYASLLGFIGGKTFEDNHTLAFIFAFGCAIGVTAFIELVRFILKKRKSQ